MMPDRRLLVIGDGPQMKELKGMCPKNVELMGHQPPAVLRECLQRARAFIFAAEEDFGIAPVEAQACGTPVIAFGKGGAVETVVPRRTGVLFDRQLPESIVGAVAELEVIEHNLNSGEIRQNAERFAIPRFRAAIGQFVAGSYEQFQDGASVPAADIERSPLPMASSVSV